MRRGAVYLKALSLPAKKRLDLLAKSRPTRKGLVHEVRTVVCGSPPKESSQPVFFADAFVLVEP